MERVAGVEQPDSEADVKLCPECRSEIDAGVHTCPVCETEFRQLEEEAMEAKLWLIGGAILGLAGVLVFGYILGPLAIIAGFQGYRLGLRRWAVVVIILGFTAMNLSLYLLFIV